MPSISDYSDEDLARGVQRGEHRMFAVLIERYEAKMLRYARKFLFAREDGQDLVQEVFLKAYTNMRSFDAGRRFSSWLYRIAHNEFINALKKKGKEPIPFFDPDTLFPHPVAREETDREANVADVRKTLDESLDKIDQKYREPLILYYYEELSYQEIAEILQIPVSTVGVRIKRGKEALKKHYEANHGVL